MSSNRKTGVPGTLPRSCGHEASDSAFPTGGDDRRERSLSLLGVRRVLRYGADRRRPAVLPGVRCDLRGIERATGRAARAACPGAQHGSDNVALGVASHDRGFPGAAMTEPLVTRDPQSVALFRLDRATLPQYLTRDQVHELVAKGCRRPRDRFFARVAFETGGRVSELLGLVRSDVDIANRQIRLRTLKRRTDRRRKIVELARWIPVSHSLCADLANWFLTPSSRRPVRTLELGTPKAESLLAATAETRIFPFTRQAAFKIIRSAGRRAGLVARGGREISPHILRHSF